MSIHPTLDVNDIRARTSVAQQEIAHAAIKTLLVELRKSASEAHTHMAVRSIDSFPSYGRLSFDGNPEHLRGADRIIWKWLEEQGLSPWFYTTVGRSGYFGGDQIGNATTYNIMADWSEVKPIGDSGFLSHELQGLRDAAVVRMASEEIVGIANIIDKAIERGEEWALVHAFEGSAKPDKLLPFDGRKEGLTGVAKQIWAYLERRNLSPRLYAVRYDTIHIAGIGRVNYGENGRGYRIAACWFDKGDKSESSLAAAPAEVLDVEKPKAPVTPKSAKRSSRKS